MTQDIKCPEHCSLGCEWSCTIHETLFVGQYCNINNVAYGMVTLAVLLGWSNIDYAAHVVPRDAGTTVFVVI